MQLERLGGLVAHALKNKHFFFITQDYLSIFHIVNFNLFPAVGQRLQLTDFITCGTRGMCPFDGEASINLALGNDLRPQPIYDAIRPTKI